MPGVEESRTPFPDTRWSIVRSAAKGSERALEELCEAYRTPVYAFFRREGNPPEVAADLTQEFFAAQILDPDKRQGILRDETQLVRFRAFLRRCLKNFAINAHKYETREKRGGGRVVSVDFEAAEHVLDVVKEEEAGKTFDWMWAKALVDRVFQQLSAEIQDDAKRVLRWTVEGKADREIGESLGITVNAVAKKRQRILARARRILLSQLRDTVSKPDDLRAELEDLGRLYALPAWLTDA